MAIDCSQCKCWIRPFEPPGGCYDCCVGKILRYANPAELAQHFNVSADLAEKIFAVSVDDSIQRLSEYQSHLTPLEYSILDDHFRHIEEKGWQWIKTNLEDRMKGRQVVMA